MSTEFPIAFNKMGVIDGLERVQNAVDAITKRLIDRNTYPYDEKVTKTLDNDHLFRLQNLPFPVSGRSLDEIVQVTMDLCSYGARTGHPFNFAGIPSPVSPVSWVGDMLSSSFNCFAGSWHGAPGVLAIEDSIISWLAAQVGLPASAGGLFVSGGSIANMTGLVLARDQQLRSEDRVRAVAYISTDTHVSVTKALRIIGFPDHQIRTIQVTSAFQMDLQVLSQAIKEDRKAGLVPFTIIATCGSTNVGRVDQLEEVSEICLQEHLWMHVDGAYGASVALSGSYRHLSKGLSRADSISWDAHKWLFQTYGCGIVLVKEKSHLLHSFKTDANYLPGRSTEDRVDFWNLGPEMTRPARALRLWFTLQVIGTEQIGTMIDHGVKLAEVAETELRKRKCWQITSTASLAILTFRYVPPGVSIDQKIDELNKIISETLCSKTIACIHNTKVNGKTVLRMVLINPTLSHKALCSLIETMDSLANEVFNGLQLE
jgi:L-2,4-diaminobutyrate decarboxylase